MLRPGLMGVVGEETELITGFDDNITTTPASKQAVTSITAVATPVYTPTAVNDYTSDFSADEDGWTVTGGTDDGNIDKDGEVDCYRFTCDSNNSVHRSNKTSLFTVGNRYRLRFSYYIDLGQSHIDGLRIRDAAITIVSLLTTTNAWAASDTYFTAEGTQLEIYGMDGSDAVFTDTGNDLFYIRNVIIDDLGPATGFLILGGADEVLGADLLNGWDFTSGWSVGGGASIDDLNSFTTISLARIYKQSFLNIGTKYKVIIAGSASVGDYYFGDGQTLVGTGDGTYYYTATAPGISIYNTVAATTDITTLELYEVLPITHGESVSLGTWTDGACTLLGLDLSDSAANITTGDMIPVSNSDWTISAPANVGINIDGGGDYEQQLTNSDFSGTWTGDLPQGWNLGGSEAGGNDLVGDDANDRVQIISDGGGIGLGQGVVAGQLYYYEVDIHAVASGALKLITEIVSHKIIDVIGITNGFLTAVDATCFLYRVVACDITINSFKLWKVDGVKFEWNGEGAADLTQSGILTVGAKNKTIYTYTYTAGTMTISCGTNTGTARSSSDTFTQYLLTEANANLVFSGNATCAGKIANTGLSVVGYP